MKSPNNFKLIFFKILKKLGLNTIIRSLDTRWKGVELTAKFSQADKAVVFVGHQTGWSTFHQRPQNLAKEIANKGYKVIYCISPYVDVYPDNSVVGIKEIQDNVFLYSDIHGWEVDANVEAIYCCYPNQYEAVLKLKQKYQTAKVIFDIFDDMSLFGSSVSDSRYRNLVKMADICCYSAKLLKPADKDEAIYIPNAVDVGHFLRREKRTKVCYFGAIDTWFDFEEVAQAIHNNKHCLFYFAGIVNPIVEKQFTKLTSNDNVIFLGKVSYEYIPDIFSDFDYGIIPFKVCDLTNSVNPIKMHEYLALGLTVISSEIMEVKCYEDQVLFYNQTTTLSNVLSKGERAKLVKTPGDSQSWSDLVDSLNVFNDKISEKGGQR